MFLPTQWLPSTHSTRPWIHRRSWQTGSPRTVTLVASLGSGLLVLIQEWQQCEVTLKLTWLWHKLSSSDMLIFFRKVPGMELNGTLGYNMNLLTELSELLVESCPTYFQCVDATCRPFSVVLISYLATEMRAAIISEELKSLIISHQILRDCKLWFDFHSSRTCSCLCRLFCLSDKHLTAET